MNGVACGLTQPQTLLEEHAASLADWYALHIKEKYQLKPRE